MAQDPLRLLCVEPRFPGRLGDIADWLVRKRGYKCWFYCNQASDPAFWPPSTGHGLEVVRFEVGGVAREASVHWIRQLERGLCYAYGAWEVLEARRPKPIDVVLGCSDGLGSTLFMPAYAPRIPVVNIFSYYVHTKENDLAEELGPSMPPEYFQWRRSSNAMDLLDLENGVVPWTTSQWQRTLYPPEYQADFRVIPEGIDTRALPSPNHRNRRLGNRSIPDSTFVLSFVASELDRLRGFDRFLALAIALMRQGHDVLAIAVGASQVRTPYDIPHYGTDYAATALAETPVPDPDRLWLPGAVPPSFVRQLLSITNLHVDPSRPFPVSRAFQEALASGALVMAWDTAPVREWISDGKTGLLVSPDDPDQALNLASRVLRDPGQYQPIQAHAAEQCRQTLDRDVVLPSLASLLGDLATK